MAEKSEGGLEIPEDFCGDYNLFKEVSYNLADIVISRVKRDHLPPAIQDIAKGFDDQYRAKYKKNLDILFHGDNADKINATIQNLKEKAEKATSDEPAWRPVAGVSNSKPYEELVLKEKKKKLIDIKTKQEERIKKLENEISRRREEVKESHKKILGGIEKNLEST